MSRGSWSIGLASISVTAILLLTLQPAQAQPSRIDCAIATKITTRVYARIDAAKKRNDTASVFALKDGFWDVARYSAPCPAITKMAKELIKKKLGEDAVMPGSSALTATTPNIGVAIGSGATGSGTLPGAVPLSPGASGSTGTAGPSSTYQNEAGTSATTGQ
ncbi:MAG: hypothetical protein AB1584_12195 [Pseudomonadota bacterium]